MIRRLWYLVLGALAMYAYERVRRAGATPNAEPMVTVTVTLPAKLYPPMVAGFGCELQAILMSHVVSTPSDDDSDDGGIDHATGLPWGGTPGDGMPEDEQ